MGEQSPDRALLEVFGVELLAYLCASHADAIEERMSGGGPLPGMREQVLDALRPIAEQARTQPGLTAGMRVEVLGRVSPGWSTSVGNLLREQTGGIIEQPEPVDPVVTPLSRIARDVYPLLLAPIDEGIHRFGPELSGVVWSHPERERFERAVLDDEALRRLFPSHSETSGHYGVVVASTGRGGHLQLWGLPGLFIGNAWSRLRSRPGEGSLTELIAELARLISDVRSAANGDSAEIPARVGFTGILLPEGTLLETASGALRAVTDAESRFVPKSLEGRVSHVGEDGVETTAQYSGDVVLECDLEYRIEVVADLDMDAWPSWVRGGTFEERIENVSLGVLLAVQTKPATVAIPTWRLVFDPLGFGPQLGWNDPQRGAAFAPRALAGNELAETQSWIDRVTTNRHPRIAVAIRRTLSAFGQRQDVTDALVDAVIAWENLFGSQQGETTLRISGAMAWLLADGIETRRDLRSEITKLYRTRSDIVHGRQVEPATLASMTPRVLELTRQTLCALFGVRPELIASDDRASELLIGR